MPDPTVRRRHQGRPRHLIVLPNQHASRLIDRKATVLILGRELRQRTDGFPSVYEVHNALTIRRNTRHCRQGRQDLQESPVVFTIELLQVDERKLGDISKRMVRRAGYVSVQEFRLDWHRRRRSIDLAEQVWVHLFQPTEARYLHRELHRGYTADPSQSAGSDEPEVITAALTDRYAAEARARMEAERAEEMLRREQKSARARLRLACNTGDPEKVDAATAALREISKRLAAIKAAQRAEAAALAA